MAAKWAGIGWLFLPQKQTLVMWKTPRAALWANFIVESGSFDTTSAHRAASRSSLKV